ncbi:MAG: murein L,D-transpeptidase [Acidobacteria bacterium]|nr:murein L,D-transpeptidase [Acidobacteriota bacterium]MBI3425620.1 murein L,D-transpeptidase [Acidobacteriota bacterium]
MKLRSLVSAGLLGAMLLSTLQAQTIPPTVKTTPSPAPVHPATPTPKPTPKLNVRPKLSEAEVNEAKTLLSNLGYWLQPEATGQDASLRHALTAFQKVEGRARTGVLTNEELQLLRQAQRPKALEPTHSHIEIDLPRQVLFVVDATGAVQRILPVSTGSGALFTQGGRTRRAVTPTGRFKVRRKIAGWRKSDLGLLYYPSYIFAGVAIHGNPAVPATPASHGCIRIPIFAAKEFFELTPVATEVLIHGDKAVNITTTGPCKLPDDKSKK